MARPQTAVILAAGPATGVYALFGTSSAAMLPVNGRPTIHWSIKYLQEQGIRQVIIGCREKDAKLKTFISQIPKSLEITLVELSDDFGPGYTLLRCLERVPENAPCLVVLGDTLFSFNDLSESAFEESFVLCSSVKDSARWCLAEIKNDKVVSLPPTLGEFLEYPDVLRSA